MFEWHQSYALIKLFDWFVGLPLGVRWAIIAALFFAACALVLWA